MACLKEWMGVWSGVEGWRGVWCGGGGGDPVAGAEAAESWAQSRSRAQDRDGSNECHIQVVIGREHGLRWIRHVARSRARLSFLVDACSFELAWCVRLSRDCMLSQSLISTSHHSSSLLPSLLCEFLLSLSLSLVPFLHSYSRFACTLMSVLRIWWFTRNFFCIPGLSSNFTTSSLGNISWGP